MGKEITKARKEQAIFKLQFCFLLSNVGASMNSIVDVVVLQKGIIVSVLYATVSLAALRSSCKCSF